MGGEDGGKIKERHGCSCISLPRQHSYKMVRKPVFTRVLATMGWRFRINLGQNWLKKKVV